MALFAAASRPMARGPVEWFNRRVPRKKKSKRSAKPSAPPSFSNQPFKGLKKASPRPAPAPPEAAPREAPAADDGSLFADAMSDVARLDSRRGPSLPPPVQQRRRRPVEDPDAEALAELSELVSGSGGFDITDTTEFLEGAVSGIDARLVRRLRRGDFAFRRHLDLHGLTVAQARESVDGFLRSAALSGERCVLIVHGRGLNSPDRVPVLKRHLVDWLSRGAWARSVMAFSSARPCDGGAGALYVLLRKTRDSKKRIRVTEGAKW